MPHIMIYVMRYISTTNSHGTKLGKYYSSKSKLPLISFIEPQTRPHWITVKVAGSQHI